MPALFGQIAIQLQPLLQAVHEIVSSATPPAEAVPAALENMQLGGNVGLLPGVEQGERSLISFRLVVGGDRDKKGRCAGGRSISAGLGGVDGGGEVGAPVGCAPDRAHEHRAAGREADDADAIGPDAVSGGVLANPAYRLLAVSARHGPD